MNVKEVCKKCPTRLQLHQSNNNEDSPADERSEVGSGTLSMGVPCSSTFETVTCSLLALTCSRNANSWITESAIELLNWNPVLKLAVGNEVGFTPSDANSTSASVFVKSFAALALISIPDPKNRMPSVLDTGPAKLPFHSKRPSARASKRSVIDSNPIVEMDSPAPNRTSIRVPPTPLPFATEIEPRETVE